MAESAPGTVARHLGGRRLGLAALVSNGLYLSYWFYISWKHLKEETGRDYYPVWHALGVLVPGINLYIAYVHLKAIRELLVDAGMETTLSPVRGAVLVAALMVANLVALFRAGFVTLEMALLLDLVAIAVFTYLMLWGQSALNRYWEQRYGERLRDAPIGRGEVLIVLLGLLSWALYWTG